MSCHIKYRITFEEALYPVGVKVSEFMGTIRRFVSHTILLVNKIIVDVSVQLIITC